MKSRTNHGKIGKIVSNNNYICKLQKGTEAGAWKGKRSLLACHIRRKRSMKTYIDSVKVKFGFKAVGVKSDQLESYCDWSSFRMSDIICKRETS